MARWLPADTDPDVFRRQIACWREMSPVERALLADQMSIDVTAIALAGIRHDRPDASTAEVRYELARRRYGKRLADEAYSKSSHES